MHAIADYQIREEIFSASTTRVCRAVRRTDGRPVVLKILRGEQIQSDAFVQYRREYELTDSLKEVPGVVRVYGIESIQDSLMIVEEDIGGESLASVLASGIDLATALDLAVRIADTLGDIHRHHVIHKDINPSNIVWNRSTGELRIIDFGIASQLSQERQEFQSVNQLEGSLAYISPEQTGRVNRKLDYRSDLYSLGVSLYQMFTGSLPFVARAGIELVHAHIALAPTAPNELNPALPPILSRIVMRLMSKMADDRYQSAWGLRNDLQHCLARLRETGRVGDFPLASNDAFLGLRIPQQLYGRERETATIMAAFDRAAAGGSELLLVSGYSGTGKSALVHEVHRPLTERRGSFVAGKFDQYQRDVPFHAWTLAFEELCRLLLKEDEAVLAPLRERILAAVGSIGKVLVDIVPSIESIIGVQPEVPPLTGEQALNRLNYVFGVFLRAVCHEGHPLVVFIDDWQWADAASLSLLKSLMAGGDLRHLLLIGAFRDNEVHAAHPFAVALDEVRKRHVTINDINLGGLTPDDVHALVGDTLGHPPAVDAVAQLVYEKTRGNAFFVVQLLNDLYEKSLIAFDAERQQWTWRQGDIAARNVADNVVDLMSEKIRRLPESTQDTLVHASCIGDRFTLVTLANLLGVPAHAAAADLEAALREGILLPIGLDYRVARQQDNTRDVQYQFIHDRVRQAAYGLQTPDAAERLHFRIARFWLAEFDAAEREQHIFDIANQYNAGRRLIGDAAQRDELLEINLLAGKRAKNATAYFTALHYFQKAIELQDTFAWNETRARSAEMHLLGAEVAFLSKDYPLMEQWLDEYLVHIPAPLDRVKALKVRLQAYVAQNRLGEAVDVGLEALGLLGIRLPKAPGQLRTMTGLFKTKLALRGKTLADLNALPPMTDPVKLAAMEILGLILPPAYWTSPGLLALTVFQMVRESLAHGYSPNAGYGFCWWGITECAMLGNIDSGFEFGQFAIDLARRHGLNLQQPLFFAAWIIHKFKRPLRETLPLFEQTYAWSLEKGDFEYASYARNNHMQALFHCGHDLTVLLREMAAAHRDLERFQLGSSLYWHDIWWQTAQNFVVASEHPDILAGPAYDEEVSLLQHLKANDASTLFLLYMAKLLLSCFFNDHEKALAYAAQARQYLKAGVGMHAFALFHYYESLALIANMVSAAGRVDGKLLRQVQANQKQLLVWAEHAPANYRHHYLLIEAEVLRATGKADLAFSQYDQAIDQARDSDYGHDEALAHELAGRCHLDRGQERLAGYYLRQALQLYERWGASAKAAHLRAEFPRFVLTAGQGATLRSGPTTIHSANSTRFSEAFDFSAVAQASQAISGEIVIDKLVTTLLKLVIEHAGAQKGVLLLKEGSHLSIQAQGRLDQTIKVDVAAMAIGDRDDLPLPRSLIQYVGRTMKSQVIHDARRASSFARDPYVVREQPLSMLCEPIVRQGKLVGMLYLENNLTAGAFTEDRLELLRLLSAQAAISIENASLYGMLEERVQERTEKLQASLAIQEHLFHELEESTRELKFAHDQLSAAHTQLQQQADSDALTGLANRRYFDERLRYELDRCARDRQSLALIMCDLDNFKRYNDTYGHVAGDECLRQAAQAMRASFSRATDLVARYGGEEFVVLLPMTTAEQAATLGEAMREAVAALAIPHSGNSFGIVTVSAGCHAIVPTADTTLEAVVRQADDALYQAKAGGRNRLVQAA